MELFLYSIIVYFLPLTLDKTKRRLAAMENLNKTNTFMHKPINQVVRNLAWRLNCVTVCNGEKIID